MACWSLLRFSSADCRVVSPLCLKQEKFKTFSFGAFNNIHLAASVAVAILY